MTDSPAQSLTDMTLARIHGLAQGNGFDTQDIAIVKSHEKIVTMIGTLTLRPQTEITQATYPGTAHNGIASRDFANLGVIASTAASDFTGGNMWRSSVDNEINASPGQGWGLHETRITCPKESRLFSASERCPSCQGQKMHPCTNCNAQGRLPCSHCQGSLREVCYQCQGRGENPAQPGHPCPLCRGTRQANCRACLATGFTPCPSCGGRKGSPCTDCQATGVISQDVAVECFVETRFGAEIKNSDDMPAGLRRNLDRLGLISLSKNHADIERIEPPDDLPQDNDASPHARIYYRATFPYAEINLRIKQQESTIYSLGKRGVLFNMPAFLDEVVHNAKNTASPSDALLQTRIGKEALHLVLQNQLDVLHLRRIFPVGLSPEAGGMVLKILKNTLLQQTLWIRIIIAGVSLTLASLLFFFLYRAPAYQNKMAQWGVGLSALADFSILCLALMMAYSAMHFGIKTFLRNKFPNVVKLSGHHLNSIGLAMILGIICADIVAISLAPIKPIWVTGILSLLRHNP